MNHLSLEEVSNLLSSISTVAARLGCGFSEAIRHLAALAVAPGLKIADTPKHDLREVARRLLRVRAQRNDVLGVEMFRDPAWDILLDLYAHQDNPDGMMISALCVGSGVPQTTALRHIYRLSEQNIVECTDHRRTMVRLSPHIHPRIEQVLVMMRDDL